MGQIWSQKEKEAVVRNPRHHQDFHPEQLAQTGQTLGEACLKGKLESSIFGHIMLTDT